MNRFILGAILLVGLVSCRENAYPEIEALGAKCQKISYPYSLDSSAVASLFSSVAALRVGDPYQKVLEKIRYPNEVNATLDKNNWTKEIGFSFVYVLRQKQESGSEAQKQKSVIRVYFDSSRTLSKTVFDTSAIQ